MDFGRWFARKKTNFSADRRQLQVKSSPAMASPWAFHRPPTNFVMFRFWVYTSGRPEKAFGFVESPSV